MLGNKGSKKFYRTGGTRGGQNQFNWENVKTDKERENYLGHTVLAPIGRWQKGKDLFWYNKLSQEQQIAKLEDEKMSFRENDDDLINQALGLKPKKRKFDQQQLDSVEVKQLLSRNVGVAGNEGGSGDGGGGIRDSFDVERIQGLGAAPVKIHDYDHIERLTSVQREIKKLQQQQQQPLSSSVVSSSKDLQESYLNTSSVAVETFYDVEKVKMVQNKILNKHDSTDEKSSVDSKELKKKLKRDHKDKRKKDKKDKKDKKKSKKG